MYFNNIADKKSTSLVNRLVDASCILTEEGVVEIQKYIKELIDELDYTREITGEPVIEKLFRIVSLGYKVPVPRIKTTQTISKQEGEAKFAFIYFAKKYTKFSHARISAELGVARESTYNMYTLHMAKLEKDFDKRTLLLAVEEKIKLHFKLKNT